MLSIIGNNHVGLRLLVDVSVMNSACVRSEKKAHVITEESHLLKLPKRFS